MGKESKTIPERDHLIGGMKMTEYGIYFILLCAIASVCIPVFVVRIANKDTHTDEGYFLQWNKKYRKKQIHSKRIKRKNKKGF